MIVGVINGIGYLLQDIRLKFGVNLDKLDTCVEECLFQKMVDQVGALNIGKFFREMNVTGHYARMLLGEYLLANLPTHHKEELEEKIIENLLLKCPSHQFEVDYHLAASFGIPVKEMDTELYDLTIDVMNKLKDLEVNNIICNYYGKKYKVPFYRLYVINQK